MGSQGGGGTMSSSSAAKARDTVKGYNCSNSTEDIKREKVEKLTKSIMKNVFKKKEPAK